MSALILLILYSTLSLSNPCVKDYKAFSTHNELFECSADSDCVLVKEACRSCTEFQLAVHKDKLDDFNKMEQKLRESSRCILSCEACEQKDYKVQCIDKKCIVSKTLLRATQ